VTAIELGQSPTIPTAVIPVATVIVVAAAVQLCSHSIATAGYHQATVVVSRQQLSSHPVFKLKLNAHSMCAQESSLHTYHTENGHKITNVTIYSIYYRIMSLQKTKSNTLGSIAAERHHNSTGNRPRANAHLEHHIEVLQIFFSF
jgi:hypothetical protein